MLGELPLFGAKVHILVIKIFLLENPRYTNLEIFHLETLFLPHLPYEPDL